MKLPHSLGNAARTIVPDFATEIDSVSVTVNAAGRSQQTQTSIATGPVTFTGLAATTWTVDLDVLKGGSVIGSGSGNVSVFSGSTSSVTIPIVFSGFDSGTGTLSLLLSWPSSTGVDYVAWSIDGGSATSAAITTDPGLGLSTTSLSASLGSGAHTLLLSFKAGGATGASAGRFVESIDIWAGLTSDSWIDGSGAVKNAMAFSTGDFLDANANLGDLVVQDGSSSGATLAVGFSSSTTSYDMYAIPSTQSIVFTPTESVAGQYISYSWNGGASTGLPSGTASAALDFNSDPSIYDNALSITVQAPNRATKTYTLTWHSAAITVGVSTATSYEALTFANNNPSVTRGNPIVIETNNSILAALDTGWAWYIDGVKQAETSQRLTLDSATTNSYSVGDHFISVILSYGGVSYAGTLILSIESH
ncbi:MAG TPA: hypothetical protein VMV83_11500 [Rectinemataceae bacterium]|nr:hypothetical protein [Rectinemataceae bacterium]